jgi:Uma2 family endonuclease
MITDIKQLDLSKQYTYADYLTWRFNERVELIKGWVLKMSPGPNRKHQEIVGEMHLALGNFLHQKPCKVFLSPFDVRLPVSSKVGKHDTVVQPDITVVCDEQKLDQQGCMGAPDIVIEILSPGNSKREMKDKFDIYQESKITEYWLIDPIREFAIIYTLDDQENYVGSRTYTSGDTLTSSVLNDFKFELNAIFDNE